MSEHGVATAAFYATARGAVAARVLRERLMTLWPDLRGQRVLGLGFAGPYLRAWREQGAYCAAAMPETVEPARWPAGGPGLACEVEDDRLPFPDLLFDRVLLVHSVELADNARRMLREVWRVLKDDGRILVVAPNRIGLWGLIENTPFGDGHNFTRGQVDRLLAGSLFRAERRDHALFVPPSRWHWVLRGYPIWEQAGGYVAPRLGGVTLTEAVKDVYSAIPTARRLRRRVVVEAA